MQMKKELFATFPVKFRPCIECFLKSWYGKHALILQKHVDDVLFWKTCLPLQIQR